MPVPYRVVRATDETPDTATIDLEPATREALPPFVPGQFAMVYAFGVGDIPLSVSGIDGRRLTHTIRAVGAISGALRTVRAGDTVGVRGPFGTGWDLPGSRWPGPADRRRRHRPGAAASARAGSARSAGRYGTLNVLIGARRPHDLLYGAETRRGGRPVPQS